MTPSWRDALVSRLNQLSDLTDPGQPDFAVEVVEAFLADVPVRIVALRDALVAGESERARLSAHALEGMCANVGADHLAGLCKVLGAEIQKSPSLATSRGFLEAIERDFGLVQEYLRMTPWRNGPSTPAS